MFACKTQSNKISEIWIDILHAYMALKAIMKQTAPTILNS